MRPTVTERTLVQAHRMHPASLPLEALWVKLGARAWFVCGWYRLPVPPMTVGPLLPVEAETATETRRAPDWWVEYWR